MDIITRFSTILLCIVALTALEAIIPLRAQPRGMNRRLATNLALTATTLAVGIPLNLVLALIAAYCTTHQIGLLPWLGIDGVVATIGAIIVLDLAAYGAHVVLHKASWAWRFHRVHHSDAAVDATTSLRQHPIESVVRFIFTAGATACTGASVGAVALYRLLSTVNAIFEHANIRVPRWLERSLVWFWVTPDMHKIHHSRRQPETDSNYANLLSLFDRSFGTYFSSERTHAVEYGLDDCDARHTQTFVGALAMPFKNEMTAGGRKAGRRRASLS